MKPFGKEAQKQNHEGLGPKWILLYQYGYERVYEVFQQVVLESGSSIIVCLEAKQDDVVFPQIDGASRKACARI